LVKMRTLYWLGFSEGTSLSEALFQFHVFFIGIL